MKTTEMILKVKEASNVTILSVRGTVILWDSMRDLGHTLYTLIDMVRKHSGMYRLFERTDGSIVLAPTACADVVGDHKINYPLEFDSFGELENWFHVSEEDATQLLTKAPAEPVPAQIEGVDLFKQVFDAIGLNYDEYDESDICYEYVQFLHRTEDRYVDIMFDKGLVQVGRGISRGPMSGEPARRLKITLVPEESNESSTAPDQRTGAEVKAG